MHILELDSYNLSDTVKFHDRLNPRLWNSAEHLRPDVAAKLMEIARDFQEFMGVPDLDVVDITISGSNAAYNYTGSSDIDLHLVINIPKVKHDEVYRELFNAKKYEYNDIHNIRIGGADVELYAQDSEQPHHSQGIYSLLNQDWISVPRRRRSTIDDVSTRSKYEDLAARVDSTIKTQDRDRMVSLMRKIKTMRQTGLEQEGEFGSDNLAFKLLRNNGYIKRLIDARNAARDAELSLAELARPRQAVTYGFTTESPDGVNPTTKMFLENEPRDQEATVQEFIAHVIDRLGIDPVPEIVLHSDSAWSKQNQSFGRYNADTHALEVNLADRHIMDILRTVAHELVHCRQNQSKPLPDHAGQTGSPWENDANARAGVIMRDYAESNPEKFTESASGYIPRNRKEARDPRFSMALTQDIRPGQVGREANKLGLKTDANGKPALLMKSANTLAESLARELELYEEQDLFEINMSPTNLKKLAAQTGAMAGMEFEMIVPDTEGGDDNDDLEPDYDYDERVTSIDDAVQFFNDGDYNGPREIRNLRDSMSDSYQEWLGEAWMEHFESYKNSIVFRYGKENWEEADIAEIMGLDEAETEALETRGATPEDYMDAAEKIIEDGLDPWLNDAQEDAQEEYYDDDHQEDWLRSQGLNYMSNIPEQYDMISWPHWSSGSDQGDSIAFVADEFREAIGRKVNWSANYHGGKRESDAYVVEPDGSLEPDDSGDSGLEFVSPPLPIDDMISDLNKVKAWAKQKGCYTNDSTGLHINVSVPGFDNDKLDYVKLALLLGDQYVLDQFGRTGNTYAKSAMGMIKERIAQRPEDAAAMLQKMKAGLGELATKVIHSGTTSKYTSINTKEGYIEFRSPGGDWLNENFDKIETTLLRFVVALDAAMDPAKYRDEYLKKLYAVLKPKDQNDTLSYFAKFAAGELPKAALKSFIKQAQLERKDKKSSGDSAYTAIPSSGNQKYQIQRIVNDEIVGTFNAASDGDANAVARQWMADNGLQRVDFRLNRATGQERAEQRTGASNYKIYQISDGRTVGTFYAADQTQADAEFTDWLMSPEAGGRDDFRYAPISTPIQGPVANQPAQAYEVYDSNTGATVYQFTAADDAAATQDGLEDYRTMGPHSLTPQQAAQRYLLRRAGTRPTPVPGIIDIETDVEQNFVPGSTLDLQRQRQQAAQQSAAAGTFRGTWAIKDSRGNTLHTFSGIGNSQADANRVAAGWLARAGYQDGLEVEVVPVMEPS